MPSTDPQLQRQVLQQCQAALPSWQQLSVDDVDFDDPKGFSSFTMGVRPRKAVEPPAVLFRQLVGKDNAILDFEAERDVFLFLGEHDIAAHCHHYDDACRIEAFYRARTLTAADVFDAEIQRGIANELYRFHQLEPEHLPSRTFFELLHDQWGSIGRHVLRDSRHRFPPHEQALCADLEAMLDDEILAKVMACLPDRTPIFCHNDTYHGNVMLLDDGAVKLLDFEFSCLNHAAFDFANLFAETVMVHGLTEPPHFRIAEASFDDGDLGAFVDLYLDNASFSTATERAQERAALTAETRRCLMLSDYMYAMAALPLALEPIQKIRFIPYAHQRFHKFLRTWDSTFG